MAPASASTARPGPASTSGRTTISSEIVDPVSDAARPDGVEGELVVSTLTRQGLPLVRYRTHDLTRVVARTRCDCGRTMLRVDRLRGRTDDMVIYKGVNFYPHQVERCSFARPASAPSTRSCSTPTAAASA